MRYQAFKQKKFLSIFCEKFALIHFDAKLWNFVHTTTNLWNFVQTTRKSVPKYISVVNLCILYIVFCSQLSLNFPRVECIMSEITGQNIIFKYASCSQKFSVWICMNLSFVKVIV